MTTTVAPRIVAPVLSGSPEAARPRRSGAKGAGLARLEDLGLRVPPWFAIPPEAFEAALRESGLDEKLPQRLSSVDGAEEVARSILRLEISTASAEAMLEARRDHLPNARWLAVRSSAVDEDAADASFAGVYDTVFVPPGGDLIDAVRRVWASACAPRAVEYRRLRGRTPADVSMAVVVQQVVEPRSSGVMFTVDPTRGDLRRVVVSAVFGAGEGLVRGDLSAHAFRVDKETLEIETEVSDLREQVVLDPQAPGGLRRVPVPEDLRDAPALTHDQVVELALVGQALESEAGRPQDVELVVDTEGRIWYLQSRPVTALEELGPAAGNPQVWESAAVAESWSGSAAPMTLAFVRRMSSIVSHCFAEVMGVDGETVRRHAPVYDDGIGFLRGRVYAQSDHRYRMLRLVPGVGFAPGKLLPLLGARSNPRLEREFPGATGWRRWTVELPVLLRTLARIGRAFWRIRRIVEEFRELFEREYRRVSEADFSRLKPHELLGLYQEVEQKLLWNWRAPILNGFFASVFYGALGKLCRAWLGGDGAELRHRLLTGEGGVDSTEPVHRLLELSALVRRDPRLRELFLESSPEELVDLVSDFERLPEFSRAFEEYVERFHFRCRRELHLEEPSLRRDSRFLLRMVANYLALEDVERLDPDLARRRERQIREQAEAEVDAALGGARRWIFRRVLDNARLGMKNRENIRFARIRMFGLARELAWALGEHLEREGILERLDDVFFLTLDEVWDFVRGSAVTVDLQGLVALRRRQQQAWSELPPPDDWVETWGMVYHRNRFYNPQIRGDEEAPGSLAGTGCSPGKATGVVKVLREGSEDLRLEGGEILAVERVNPSLVPLYPSLAGLLIEQGDALSHSVIVAREMGLPTIVNLQGLTRTLEDGMRVEMNGTTGRVTWELSDG